MKSIWNRRSFLKKSALSSLFGLIGFNHVSAKNIRLSANLPSQPSLSLEDLPDKHPEMIILNNRPWNVQAPPHLLDDKVTPGNKMFIRNNGNPPVSVDSEKWELTIDGESAKTKKTYTINELKNNFNHYSFQLTLECGGNGRAAFSPPASGNQWTEGAVSCGKWTGVKLKDLLLDVGIQEDVVYIGYYGADTHLSGDPSKNPISRGIPIKKALEDEVLVAWSLNDEEIPKMNGYPLRLVVGGWPASTSGKWLQRISIRNKIHDGAKMGGMSYRVPKYSVEPGQKVPEEDFEIIESMPVKSLITNPKTGAMLPIAKSLNLKGHAWAGDLEVSSMHVSIDFGSTWQKCKLEKPVNRHAWQHWSHEISFPEKGYYEVWAKATDSEGKSQPMVIPGWNPKGYLNNATHRIAVKIK